MKTIKIFFATLLLISFVSMNSCSSKKLAGGNYASNGNPLPKGQSTDETYGYTEENPIRVGGAKKQKGPINERAFLDALAGPNGESIKYVRQGSCCPFTTPNGLFENSGMLDIYVITWKGQDEPVKLYINMYDYEQPQIPVGFTEG